MKQKFTSLLLFAAVVISSSSLQSCKKESTTSSTGYYFAVTSLDEWGNESSVSNVVFHEQATAPSKPQSISELNPQINRNYKLSKSAYQSTDGAVKNVVRVKFKKPLEGAELNVASDQRSIGISNIDRATSQIKGAKLYKCFRSGPKNQERHRQAGLDLWYYVVFDSKSESLSRVISTFDGLGEVEYVESIRAVYKSNDGQLTASSNPSLASKSAQSKAMPFNDPLLKDQWHYDNLGINGIHERANVNLFNAWTKNTGDKDVIVAVVDSGIDFNHEDLRDAMWVNEGEVLDGTDTDGNGYIDDIHGYNFSLGIDFASTEWPAELFNHANPITPGDHGTHVAGTIGAVNNNGLGVCGVAGGSDGSGGVRLMSTQIFTPEGSADDTGYFLSDAIVYGADNGAILSQNSWRIRDKGEVSVLLHEAFEYFMAYAGKEDLFPNSPMNGGIVVACTGNDDSIIPQLPVLIKDIVGVASTNHERKRSDTSNYGITADVSAPGGNTREESGKVGVFSTITNNQYAYKSGTSMATPHVTGIAALYISQNKGQVTPEMVRRRLVSSCNTLMDTEPDYAKFMGAGLIDADKVLRVNDNTPPSPVADLIINQKADNSFELQWTIPADANDYVSSYKIYFSKNPITSLSGIESVTRSYTKITSGEKEVSII